MQRLRELLGAVIFEKKMKMLMKWWAPLNLLVLTLMKEMVKNSMADFLSKLLMMCYYYYYYYY